MEIRLRRIVFTILLSTLRKNAILAEVFVSIKNVYYYGG